MPAIVEAAEVLREIHDEGVLNVAHLARRFGVSPEAVRELVNSLQAQGYLEAMVEPGCPNNSGWLCRFCPLRASCQVGTLGIKLYRLTEEGQRIIAGRDGERREKGVWQQNS